MFTRLIKGLNKQDCPSVLSITNAAANSHVETIIQRNHVSGISVRENNEIYNRAREIYFRARRQRPVRASSIF